MKSQPLIFEPQQAEKRPNMKAYGVKKNGAGQVVFEADPAMDVDAAIKEHGAETVINAVALEAIGTLASDLEVPIDGLSPKDALGAVLEWGKAMAAELGCEPNLPAILDAMKAQKKELAGARIHAELAVAKLTPTEHARCERKGIDKKAYARAKASLTLDELKKLEAQQGDAVAFVTKRDARRATARKHGITEREVMICEQNKTDLAKYASTKKAMMKGKPS